MAAKALIFSAFISLLAQRQMASTHMRRKPMARRPMYMNSLMTESHRTPERGQEQSCDGARRPAFCRFPFFISPTLRLSRRQLDEAATLFLLVVAYDNKARQLSPPPPPGGSPPASRGIYGGCRLEGSSRKL